MNEQFMERMKSELQRLIDDVDAEKKTAKGRFYRDTLDGFRQDLAEALDYLQVEPEEEFNN